MSIGQHLYVRSKNRESQAVFACAICSYETHTYIKAIRNILAAGLAVLVRRRTSHAEPIWAEHSDSPVKRQPLKLVS